MGKYYHRTSTEGYRGKNQRNTSAPWLPGCGGCAYGGCGTQETGRLSHGIIISGTKLSDMDYTDLLNCLPRYFDLLLLDTTQNVSYRRQPGLIAVTMPVRVLEFVGTVNMMLQNLDRQVVKRKGKKPRRTEKEENYIRNAKSVLMERNHMTEEEAFRYIQKSSMDTGRNMTETAQMILTLIYNEI